MQVNKLHEEFYCRLHPLSFGVDAHIFRREAFGSFNHFRLDFVKPRAYCVSVILSEPSQRKI